MGIFDKKQSIDAQAKQQVWERGLRQGDHQYQAELANAKKELKQEKAQEKEELKQQRYARSKKGQKEIAQEEASKNNLWVDTDAAAKATQQEALQQTELNGMKQHITDRNKIQQSIIDTTSSTTLEKNAAIHKLQELFQLHATVINAQNTSAQGAPSMPNQELRTAITQEMENGVRIDARVSTLKPYIAELETKLQNLESTPAQKELVQKALAALNDPNRAQHAYTNKEWKTMPDAQLIAEIETRLLSKGNRTLETIQKDLQQGRDNYISQHNANALKSVQTKDALKDVDLSQDANLNQIQALMKYSAQKAQESAVEIRNPETPAPKTGFLSKLFRRKSNVLDSVSASVDDTLAPSSDSVSAINKQSGPGKDAVGNLVSQMQQSNPNIPLIQSKQDTMQQAAQHMSGSGVMTEHQSNDIISNEQKIEEELSDNAQFEQIRDAKVKALQEQSRSSMRKQVQEEIQDLTKVLSIPSSPEEKTQASARLHELFKLDTELCDKSTPVCNIKYTAASSMNNSHSALASTSAHHDADSVTRTSTAAQSDTGRSL